jgi:ParB family chromosome partitioning protein
MFDPVARAELTQSVKRLGILQPITVRYVEVDDAYQIIAGERRFRAAQEAGLTEVPCWVQTPRDQDVLLQQIVENWQRADLHPFDLADSLARLRDTMRFSQKELAVETGKSEGEISKLLAILALDPDVQKLAREDTTGTITKRHLYAIVKCSPQAQHAAIHAIVRHQLTVEDTDRLVAKERSKSHAAKRGAPVTRLTFRTTQATVVMTFRRKEVRPIDIVAVLEDLKRQVEKSTATSPSMELAR